MTGRFKATWIASYLQGRSFHHHYAFKANILSTLALLCILLLILLLLASWLALGFVDALRIHVFAVVVFTPLIPTNSFLLMTGFRFHQ